MRSCVAFFFLVEKQGIFFRLFFWFSRVRKNGAVDNFSKLVKTYREFEKDKNKACHVTHTEDTLRSLFHLFLDNVFGLLAVNVIRTLRKDIYHELDFVKIGENYITYSE